MPSVRRLLPLALVVGLLPCVSDAMAWRCVLPQDRPGTDVYVLSARHDRAQQLWAMVERAATRVGWQPALGRPAPNAWIAELEVLDGAAGARRIEVSWPQRWAALGAGAVLAGLLWIRGLRKRGDAAPNVG